jgi:hypothetical protein
LGVQSVCGGRYYCLFAMFIHTPGDPLDRIAFEAGQP